MINYFYTDLGCQILILDIGAPVSLAGVLWMTQYLKELDLTIKEMKSTKCSQPFRFGPSKRYFSKMLVELPVLVKRLDSRVDILIIQTYLVDAKVSFLCRKRNLRDLELQD